MKIRTKIALMYTQLIFMILLGAFTVVYVLNIRSTESSFYDALWERAMVTAQVNFGQEEIPDYIYQNLLNEYRFSLNQERRVILNADRTHIADSLKKSMPERYIRTVLQGKTVEFQMGERHSIAMYYPTREGNYIIIVSAFDKKGYDTQMRMLKNLMIILVSCTVIVFLIGLVYAKQVMDPVRTLIKNARRITANNLKKTLREEPGNDELLELSRTLNNMIERLRTSFDMQNSFIRNASHELRNPLTAILGETEIALSKPRTPEEYERTLKTVLFETERLHTMMQALLMLAQTDFDFSRIPKERVYLDELFETVGNDIKKRFPRP